MKESTKTILLILLIIVGVATIFWGRWRLKNQLSDELGLRHHTIIFNQTSETAANHHIPFVKTSVPTHT